MYVCAQLKLMLKYGILISLVTIGMMWFGSCARVGSPTGGPRDTIPPKLVYSEPEPYATNFTDNEVELEFNEYIQLNNINSELIISPPVDEKPQIKLRGRSLLIDLNNEMRDSVTYTLNFGEAIVDNNERNPLSGFEFVFSTGGSIDSFSVAGKLVKSFTLEPYEERVHIMLYDNLEDSVPMKMLPAYLGKTTGDGSFSINNIKSDTFKIFALKDANANLLYDLPNEEIAFYDSAVHISPAMFKDKDTVIVDSSLIDFILEDTLTTVADTATLTDTAEYRKTYTFYTPLFMFKEKNEVQYLTDDNREDKHRLRMIFNIPVDTIHFEAINIERANWYIPEYSITEDTIDLWLADTNLVKNDSIYLKVDHYGVDTAQNKVWLTDTILFKYTGKTGKQTRGRRKGEQKAPEREVPGLLNINISNNATVDLNARINITSKYPVTSVDTNGVHLSWFEDSIKNDAAFEFVADTFPERNFKVNTNWKEATSYELFIEPGTFRNIYHYPQDTILLEFKTQSKDYYGTVILNLKNVPSSLIVQLFSNDQLVRERMVQTDGKLTFDYLAPKDYRVKVIYDKNNNGEWDPGVYLQGIQPERVNFYDEGITVRSNWEIEYEWDVGL